MNVRFGGVQDHQHEVRSPGDSDDLLKVTVAVEHELLKSSVKSLVKADLVVGCGVAPFL